MDLKKFSEKVRVELMGYLAEDVREKTESVEITNTKTNSVPSVTLKLKEGKLSPQLVLQDYFNDYQDMIQVEIPEEKAVEVVLTKMAVVLRGALDNVKDLSTEAIFAGRNITACLINKEANEELLKTAVHKEFLDLAIVYRKNFYLDGIGDANTIVTLPLLNEMGLTPDELHELAMNNQDERFSPVAKSMLEIFAEDFGDDPFVQMMIAESTDDPMTVISNQSKTHGAGAMLNKALLQGVADKKEDDLYIIPSSIHEVITIPASHGAPEDILQMVMEVNGEQVAPEERLANSVYLFSRETGEITILLASGQKVA